jgi:predicted Fe-S protein YdhL (DUF1289 family)
MTLCKQLIHNRSLDSAPAHSANPQAGSPRSPCTNVCRIDPATGWCAGCWRTIDEIADWSSLDDAGKLGVWARIEARRGDQGRGGGDSTGGVNAG